MQLLSVVIICKNKAEIISGTLNSLPGLTDDIIVFDNGSTDATIEKVKQFNVQLHQGNWEGFGKTKNKANALAKYDWILSLDADETIDDELKSSLLQLDLSDDQYIYEIRFKNFLGNKWLRFGEWGNDKHIRLFNRTKVQWNVSEVHELLIFPEGVKKILLPGYVLHKTALNFKEYEVKMKNYAYLNAKKYFRLNKKAGGLRIFLSPAFSFIKNYIFKLGFLDGSAGFTCARINASYTFLKYKKLNELNMINRSE